MRAFRRAPRHPSPVESTMPYRTTAFALLIVLSTWLPLAGARDDSKTPDPARALSQMDWLSGSWAGDMWGGKFVAYYTTPEGGKIISHSRLMKDDQVAFYEFEVFEREGETVFMRPFPGGNKADDLMLVGIDREARKATFENPKKDYPTRITYQRAADDELVIVLSDPHGKSEKVERFELKRAAAKD